jgi:hypothetical protein
MRLARAMSCVGVGYVMTTTCIIDVHILDTMALSMRDILGLRFKHFLCCCIEIVTQERLSEM